MRKRVSTLPRPRQFIKTAFIGSSAEAIIASPEASQSTARQDILVWMRVLRNGPAGHRRTLRGARRPNGGEIEDNSRCSALDAREAAATSKPFASISLPLSICLPTYPRTPSPQLYHRTGVWQLMNCPSAVATYSPSRNPANRCRTIIHLHKGTRYGVARLTGVYGAPSLALYPVATRATAEAIAD